MKRRDAKKPLIALLAQKTFGHCGYCGVKLELDAEDHNSNLYPTIDHIIPISEGGNDNPENLLLACRRCNCGKRDRTLDEYRQNFYKKMGAKFSPEQIAYLRMYGIEVPPPPKIEFFFERIYTTPMETK